MKKIFTLAAAVAVALGMSAEINILRGDEVLTSGAEFEVGYKDGEALQTWDPNLFIQSTAGTKASVKVASNCPQAQFCGAFDQECAIACPETVKSGTFADEKPLPLEIHVVLLPGSTLPDGTTVEVSVWEEGAEDAAKTVKFNCVDLSDSEVGIESIVADMNLPAQYYTLQGVRVNNPVQGSLYIVRQGSKVSKVIF